MRMLNGDRGGKEEGVEENSDKKTDDEEGDKPCGIMYCRITYTTAASSWFCLLLWEFPCEKGVVKSAVHQMHVTWETWPTC